MKCNECNRVMSKVDRRDEISDLNEDATDGQIADYIAAECSGDYGAWGLGIVEYHCSQCKLSSQIVSDTLPCYYPLIEAWHTNASHGDTFSRFVFQYLAFIAHLKHQLFFDARTDREAIQRLKRDNKIRDIYLKLLNADNDLQKYWNEIITELSSKPLYNSSSDPDYPTIDKWWDCSGNQPHENNEKDKGKVHELGDWQNMVEYWYSIRNNLFHGGKSPNSGRDAFLVEHAYQTLRPLVGCIFLNTK